MATRGLDPRDKLDRLQKLDRHKQAPPLPSTERSPHQPASPPERVTPADRHARAASRTVQPFGKEGPQLRDIRPGVLVRRDMAGALAALAASRPDVLQKALVDHQDGTFSVRFLEQAFGGGRDSHVQTVDGYVPANALAIEQGGPGTWERLWPAIVEKAYAAWKGSYEAVGPEGRSGEILTALTGSPVRQLSTAVPEAVLTAALGEALAQGRPVTCTAGGEDDPDRRRPFVVHVVMAVHADGVTVRDPLAGSEDVDAPEVSLTLPQFRAKYDAVAILGPAAIPGSGAIPGPAASLGPGTSRG